MDKIISCKFNIDTACVEVKYADGSRISINCTINEQIHKIAKEGLQAINP